MGSRKTRPSSPWPARGLSPGLPGPGLLKTSIAVAVVVVVVVELCNGIMSIEELSFSSLCIIYLPPRRRWETEKELFPPAASSFHTLYPVPTLPPSTERTRLCTMQQRITCVTHTQANFHYMSTQYSFALRAMLGGKKYSDLTSKPDARADSHRYPHGLPTAKNGITDIRAVSTVHRVHRFRELYIVVFQLSDFQKHDLALLYL